MARVSYADLWGLRDGKYRYLLENDVSTTDWLTLEPFSPYFFLVPKDLDLLTEYHDGWSLPDALPLSSTGIKTHRDHFAIAFEESDLKERIRVLLDVTVSDDAVRDMFGLRDTRDWDLHKARERLRTLENWPESLTVCLYRPFDHRPIYYSPDLIELPRLGVMRHMFRDNIGLIVNRQIRVGRVAHFWVASCPVDFHVLETAHASMTFFPLYVYTSLDERGGEPSGPAEQVRQSNLSPEFIAAVADKLLLDFVRDGKGDLENTFGPEDVFHYMYAVFHSPTYRERYAEFLKIDFPRLPLTSDLDLFRALAEKGEELVALHLMESANLNDLTTAFPVSDSNEVEKVRYAETSEERPGRVYINKTQYFEGVEPDVWEFHIGGYQVLHKWLKDRKGRKLSFDDLLHYQKIVVALKETMRLMEEVDELIPGWPIE